MKALALSTIPIVCIVSALSFAVSAREAKLRQENAEAQRNACVTERRECGKSLDWCQVTTKGTIDWVAERLRNTQAPPAGAR